MIASSDTPFGATRMADKTDASKKNNETKVSRTRQFQLERMAYRFWQEGGRRDGDADADWYRAEAALSL
ncbi:MAG: DUF2934 domain-containing protein [Bryobacteraceae bacterium]